MLRLELAYWVKARPIWCNWLTQTERRAISLAFFRLGKRMAISKAMMATTTSTSIRVNADGRRKERCASDGFFSGIMWLLRTGCVRPASSPHQPPRAPAVDTLAVYVSQYSVSTKFQASNDPPQECCPPPGYPGPCWGDAPRGTRPAQPRRNQGGGGENGPPRIHSAKYEPGATPILQQ